MVRPGPDGSDLLFLSELDGLKSLGNYGPERGDRDLTIQLRLDEQSEAAREGDATARELLNARIQEHVALAETGTVSGVFLESLSGAAEDVLKGIDLSDAMRELLAERFAYVAGSLAMLGYVAMHTAAWQLADGDADQATRHLQVMVAALSQNSAERGPRF